MKCPHLQKVSNSCNKKDIVTFLNFPGWTLLRFSVFQIFNSKIGKLSGPNENSISWAWREPECPLHVECRLRMFKLISSPLTVGGFSRSPSLVPGQPPTLAIGQDFPGLHVDKFIAFLVFQKFEYQWSLSIVSGWVRWGGGEVRTL